MQHRLAIAVMLSVPPQVRLVASWPRVTYDPEQPLAEVFPTWARVSGLPLQVVEQVGPSLVANGLCRPDGVVDEAAAAYARGVVAAELRQYTHGGGS